MTGPEEWRDITGWEGCYQVSSAGRVRSVTRVVIRSDGHPRTVTGTVLKARCSPDDGYPRVNLWRGRKPTNRTVHTLVAEAFLGPRPSGKEVCHNNGVPSDVGADNLRWDTHKANEADKETHPNSLKTHCPQGHPYDEQNTAHDKGRRRCRACNRNRHTRRAAE